jgi:hypothetical protein
MGLDGYFGKVQKSYFFPYDSGEARPGNVCVLGPMRAKTARWMSVRVFERKVRPRLREGAPGPTGVDEASD